MSHVYQCRVRWSDVDSYGHVNNVKYLEYYQEARIAFLASLVQNTPGGMVVARLDIDYRRPILFRSQPYEIHSRVSKVGRSSFELDAEIRGGDDVLSRGHAVVVSFDGSTQRSTPLPDDQRAALVADMKSDG